MTVDRRKATRFGAFVRDEALSPTELAQASGYSRQHIYLVRVGRKAPSVEFMRAVLHAASRIKSKRYRIDDLFDLEARPRRKAS